MMVREPIVDTHTTARLRELTSTQAKHVANAVLPALRRGPTHCTPGLEQRYAILGASGFRKQQPPLPHTRWWIGRAGAHDGLDLPEVGLMITDLVHDIAPSECRRGAWDDLQRIVTQQPRTQAIFLVRYHPRTGWFAQNNPAVGRAGEAALTLVRLALEMGDVTAHPPVPHG